MASSSPIDLATADQVRKHADAIRHAARDVGASNVRLLDNGTVVIHSGDLGYGHVIELVGRAQDIVGTYVHVITDDVPAAAGAQPL